MQRMCGVLRGTGLGEWRKKTAKPGRNGNQEKQEGETKMWKERD